MKKVESRLARAARLGRSMTTCGADPRPNGKRGLCGYAPYLRSSILVPSHVASLLQKMLSHERP
jgi:hypothetical protein